MASEAGRPIAGLRDQLEDSPEQFSLFQALRLLEFSQEGAPPIGLRGPFEREAVRLRSDPSLSFPKSSVVAVERETNPTNGRERAVLTTPILGLYGPDSPLAEHVTEDILHEREDETAVRDFLDIINHRLMGLLYRSWSHYRLYVQCRQWGEDSLSRQLEALIDLKGQQPEALGDESLMPVMGLLMQRPRSASGLETLLGYFFPGVRMRIKQCIPRTVLVASEQRSALGAANASLGKNTFMGQKVFDTTGKFRVVVELSGNSQLGDFQAGGASYARLAALTDLWCQDALDWELELILREQDVTLASISSLSPTTRLGVNSWLGRPSSEGMTMIVDRD